MKKSIIISSIILVIGLSLLIFTQSQSAKALKINSELYIVKFHVTGCDDNCANLAYCIGSGPVYHPGTCTFGVSDLPVGWITIWIGCPNNKGAIHRFYYYGGNWDEDVTVTSPAPACPCMDKK